MKQLLLVLAVILALLLLVLAGAWFASTRFVPSVTLPASIFPSSVSSPENTGASPSTRAILPANRTPLPPGSLLVLAKTLHLRQCPSIDCNVLTWLMAGERLTWSGICQHDWALLATPPGWVHSYYLKPDPCP